MSTGTKIGVSAAVLVVAACVYFVVRTPTDVELEGAAVESPAVDPDTDAVRRSVVAEEPPVGAPPVGEPSVGKSAVTKKNVLRVILEGITEENAPMTTVTLTGVDKRAPQWPAEIRDSWPCQGLTSEFDLDPFFASVAERDGDLRLDELEVHVDHPLHEIEWTRVPLSRGVERKSGQTVYEARVRLVPAGVIYGRLARADGAPAAKGLVGALLLEGDFPIEEKGRAVECAADGAFELRVSASGRYALASYEKGRRPTTTRMDALVGTRVDVGIIVLESGHAITGQAVRQDNPLAGASVSATPPTWKTAAAPDAVNGMHASVYEGRTFATPARSVHLLWLPPAFSSRATESGLGSRRDGRFELAGQRVSVDENGAFAFRGLGSGEYLLRMRELADAHDSLPGYWDNTEAEGLYRIHGDRPALVVRAPEHGVVFPFRWTSVRFEFAGDLESEDEGRLLVRTKSGSTGVLPEDAPKGLTIAPKFFSSEFQLSGDKPIFVLQAPPTRHITGEVAFPGWQPVPLEFWTPKPGGEVVVPVKLVRAKTATLLVELKNPQAEIPESFLVKLWPAGKDDDPPNTRSAEARGGQLRVEGIFPGKYRVRVRAGRDNRSAGLFHENEFDLELHPGLVVTRSIMMRQGAGLRFTVRGADGALLSGQYEFFDASGRPVDLNTHVLENKQAASSWEIYPHGTHESFNELHPGRYRLVLRSKGYKERGVKVELRAGAYKDVDITLTK